MDMGGTPIEHGARPRARRRAAGPGSGARDGEVSVTSLIADPDRPADVRVELVARQETIDVPGGRRVEGYTVNGSSPGPVIRAQQGDLVEVSFVNESVAAGATLHWHGIDVPNAADGVAGITQDAVPVGGRHVYRFEATDAGTYWYHSHQVSHEQVERGLLGAIVIDPARRRRPIAADRDVTALLHVYGGQHTLNGRVEDERVDAEPGSTVRVRVINTDQGTAAVWSAAPFRVLATDGHEVNEPDRRRRAAAAHPRGRTSGCRGAGPVAGSRAPARRRCPQHRSSASPRASAPPCAAAVGDARPARLRRPRPRSEFDATSPDRTFDYVIGRRFGIIDGRPGNFWTINGRLFPDVPMFHVREGDVVVMRIRNDTGEVHPMHLHGHHVVVLSRDGEAASGSPWWVDSLDVHPGESYEIAFVADNPGIWSDHCHTLPHAVDGLVAHLMYEGVSTPFTINGEAGNQPE